jgi:hypothetical protein
MSAKPPFTTPTPWFMGNAEAEAIPMFFETARKFGIDIDYDYLTGNIHVRGGTEWEREAFWEEIGNRAAEMTQTKSIQFIGWTI